MDEGEVSNVPSRSLLRLLAVVLVASPMLMGGPSGATSAAPAPPVSAITLPPDAPAGASSERAASALACGTRATEWDQPDTTTAYRWQVIYFVPAGACDETLDSTVIVNSMNSLNAWFVNQGFKPMRLDRTSSGAIDIPFVRGKNPTSSYGGLGAVQAELSQLGFAQYDKKYLVFAAISTGGVCGEGEWPGQYAAVYLGATPACGTRNFGNGTLAGAGQSEVVTGQEALHTEGVVSLTALHQCFSNPGHVCTVALAILGSVDPENTDVMFPYVIGHRLNQKILDRGHDDYFNRLGLRGLETSPYFG